MVTLPANAAADVLAPTGTKLTVPLPVPAFSGPALTLNQLLALATVQVQAAGAVTLTVCAAPPFTGKLIDVGLTLNPAQSPVDAAACVTEMVTDTPPPLTTTVPVNDVVEVLGPFGVNVILTVPVAVIGLAVNHIALSVLTLHKQV